VPAGLERLAGEVGRLLGDDPNRLGGALAAAQVLALELLEDQLAAAKLHRLAVVDAQGAAGAERGVQFTSTAGWLRARLRMSPGAATQRVRTARALYRGPLTRTGQALADAELSYQHAVVLAEATRDLPPARVAEAEPILLDAARRLDPARLRRLATHAREVIDPERAEDRTRRRLDHRGLWLSPTFEGMVDVEGLLDPEAGEAVRAALEPLARPTGPDDGRSGAQRRADALGELARGALQTGRLPDSGGLRPQVTVTADLASLLARHGVGGSGAWGGVFDGETVRRLACDAVLTRAIVNRHPGGDDGQASTRDGPARDTEDGHPDATHGSPGGVGDATTTGSSPTLHDHPHRGQASRDGHAGNDHHAGPAGSGHATHDGHAHADGGQASRGGATTHTGTSYHRRGDHGGGLAEVVRAAVALLPPPLGAPVEVLDLGRATRVISPALRRALAVRDGGCAAHGCDRAPGWADAHHLRHWLHGGATSLDNLVLLCRVHHVAVHEQGWQLHRDPSSSRVVLTPPARRQPRSHSPPAT
jgi:hypothetical protein